MITAITSKESSIYIASMVKYDRSIIINYFKNSAPYLHLNQAHTSLQPVHAWFLKISFVREVNVCTYVLAAS